MYALSIISIMKQVHDQQMKPIHQKTWNLTSTSQLRFKSPSQDVFLTDTFLDTEVTGKNESVSIFIPSNDDVDSGEVLSCLNLNWHNNQLSH